MDAHRIERDLDKVSPNQFGARESWAMLCTDARYHAIAFARETAGTCFDVPPPLSALT